MNHCCKLTKGNEDYEHYTMDGSSSSKDKRILETTTKMKLINATSVGVLQIFIL